ncbi:transposase [Streptomyces sp. NPDC056231]|uniref:transposase n=1 Tax=Streptomyces sp. NPDC056231 TaxID=3345755 RepID=UPI003AAF9522
MGWSATDAGRGMWCRYVLGDARALLQVPSSALPQRSSASGASRVGCDAAGLRGYDVACLSHALADLPIVLVGRLRSDRVMLRDPGPARSGPKGGRPHRRGGALTLAKPDHASSPSPRGTCRTTQSARTRRRDTRDIRPRPLLLLPTVSRRKPKLNLEAPLKLGPRSRRDPRSHLVVVAGASSQAKEDILHPDGVRTN